MAKEKNEVAVLGLDKVPGKLAMVQARKKELNDMFGGNDNDIPSSTIVDPFGDLATCSDVTTLVQACSLINGRAGAYKNWAKELGVSINEYPFRINNVTVKKMTAYIKRRIGEVTFQDELDELNGIEEELLKLSSEEDKKIAAFAKLEDKLAKYAEKRGTSE